MGLDEHTYMVLPVADPDMAKYEKKVRKHLTFMTLSRCRVFLMAPHASLPLADCCPSDANA